MRAIWKGVISPHLLGIENFLGDFSCFLVPNRFGRQWRHQRVLQASLRRDCTGEHIMLRKYNWDFSTVSVEFGRDDDDSEENMSEWAISARNLIDNFRKSHHGWKQLEYLSATRLKPQRFYEVGVKGERLDGGFTMHALLTDTTLKNKVNTALDDILGVKIYTKQLSSQFSTSGKTNLYDVRVGKQAAKAKLQLPDVGFGISQLLPVLVSMQRTDHLLLVEEPESNLHPKAQTHLIETILNSVDKDSGPSILMETHSEHFLVRVLQLIESGQISDEDISIIYVDTDSENGTTVKHIRTKDGVMVDEMPKALSHLENFTNSIL